MEVGSEASMLEQEKNIYMFYNMPMIRLFFRIL